MRLKLRAAKRRLLARGTFDLLAAMAVIWLLTLPFHTHHGRVFFLLSLAIAGITACNLAFLRHLRRAYASPRRGVWRRD
jgi:hypothetical protein